MSDMLDVANAIERRIAKLETENERLRVTIADAIQRLNESGTGEMGLLDTIHATHAILKR